jgi:excisionase family DNA binding protein
MATTELRAQTYLPEGDSQALAEFYDFLVAGHAPEEGGHAQRYFLADSELGQQMAVPASVYPVLRQVLEVMSHGLAVTVVPQSQNMTTQQAAELLGVSRPTLIRILDRGLVPFQRVGTHRRVELGDLLAYRRQRREDQYEALAATAVDVDDEKDVDSVLESLRAARRQVAEQRRSRSV